MILSNCFLLLIDLMESYMHIKIDGSLKVPTISGRGGLTDEGMSYRDVFG